LAATAKSKFWMHLVQLWPSSTLDSDCSSGSAPAPESATSVLPDCASGVPDSSPASPRVATAALSFPPAVGAAGGTVAAGGGGGRPCERRARSSRLRPRTWRLL
jgi:hypothetical protein